MFNIEWRDCLFGTTTTCAANGDTSYEVQLVEGTSTFNIIFGTMGSATATRGAVGVQKNGTTFTQSLQHWWDDRPANHLHSTGLPADTNRLANGYSFTYRYTFSHS